MIKYHLSLWVLLVMILAACAGSTSLSAQTPAPGPRPASPPMIYQPTPLPGVPDLVACPDGPDTDEMCLPDGNVRLVGYLTMSPDGSQGYFLQRGPGRASVIVTPGENYPTDTLRWLRDHNTLALVEGQVISLDPPTLLISGVGRERPAARPFSRSAPLAEVYTNSKLGFAIELPAGWIVEDSTERGMGGGVSIQNYHANDLGRPPTESPDPSLYRVEIVPILPHQATTIAQMRSQIEGQALREQTLTINGLEAIRLSVNAPPRGRTDILLVQLPSGVLLLQTWQDPALFERMIETLRPVDLTGLRDLSGLGKRHAG